MNNAVLLDAANSAVNAVNAVNDAFANVVNTATNAVVQNVVNQNAPTSSTMQFLLFVAGVVAVTLGGYYLYMRWVAGRSGDAAEAVAAELPVPERQVWCFVGEDDSGRWCVRVPSDSACTADRAYATQKGCESPASAAAPVAALA